MAEHKVTMKVRTEVYTAVSFTVRADGKKLGELLISKGTIEYVPNKRSVNTVKLNWSQFNDLMKERLE